MGFYATMDINAKCPLYEGFLRNYNGSIAGVQCQYLHPHFGFNARIVVQLKNVREALNMKELLCDDRYKACPYYQAYMAANEKK